MSQEPSIADKIKNNTSKVASGLSEASTKAIHHVESGVHRATDSIQDGIQKVNDKVKNQLHEKGDKIKNKTLMAKESTEKKIKENPLKAVGIAAGVGALLTLLLKVKTKK